MCCKLCLSIKIITTIQLHLVERWFVLLQLSVTVEHATGGPHKAAYNKFLTKKGLGLRERTAKVNGWHDTGQMSLVKPFDIAKSANFEKKKMKFKTAYFIAKEQLLISKFKKNTCVGS